MSSSLIVLRSLAAIFLIMASFSASADELHLIHPGASGSLYEQSAMEFADRVNQHLPEGYHVVVEPMPLSSDGEELLEELQAGSATLAIGASAMLNIGDHFAIFELPYLFRNRAQVRAIRTKLLEPYLQPEAARHGIHILGVWENGFRHMTNNRQPVSKPQDLRNMRIAVTNNGWRKKSLQAFGAEAVPLPPGAIAEAVYEGQVDGQEAPLSEIAAFRLLNTQRHLILSDHLYTPAFLITDQAKFADLPKEVQDILSAEAENMESWVQSTAIAIESDLIDRLDLNMEVSHANVRAFEAAGRIVYRDFIRSIPDSIAMIQIIESIEEVTAAK